MSLASRVWSFRPTGSVLARLWGLRSERPVFVALAGLVLVVLLSHPIVDWCLRTGCLWTNPIAANFTFWDFGAYGGAVNRWQAGEPIYQQNENGGFHGTFLYPPVFLLLFQPFVSALPSLVGPLPIRTGAIAWTLFSVAILWIGLQLAIDACGVDLRVWERAGLLWVILGFQPLLLSIKMGQTAALLSGLLAHSFVGLVYGRRGNRFERYASGAYTAFVGTFKLSYAPAGAHLLANRDRLLGAVATGIVLAGASILVFGVATNRTYVEVLLWGLGRSSGARSPALWLAPYYRPLAWLPHALAITVGASIAIVAGAVLARPNADRETFALGVAAFPLLSPLTYTYYFVALLPAVVALLAVELGGDGDGSFNGRPSVPLVGLLLLHLHSFGLKFLVNVLPDILPVMREINQLFSQFYFLLQPGLWGNLVLVGLAATRVAQSATVPAWLQTAVDRRVPR